MHNMRPQCEVYYKTPKSTQGHRMKPAIKHRHPYSRWKFQFFHTSILLLAKNQIFFITQTRNTNNKYMHVNTERYRNFIKGKRKREINTSYGEIDNQQKWPEESIPANKRLLLRQWKRRWRRRSRSSS